MTTMLFTPKSSSATNQRSDENWYLAVTSGSLHLLSPPLYSPPTLNLLIPPLSNPLSSPPFQGSTQPSSSSSANFHKDQVNLRDGVTRSKMTFIKSNKVTMKAQLTEVHLTLV